MESLIVVSCVGLSGNANEACNKALQAGSQQSGIMQMTDTFENKETKSLEKGAVSVVGEKAVGVAGGTVWLTKSIVEKKASFGLFGPFSTEIGADTTKLVLKCPF